VLLAGYGVAPSRCMQTPSMPASLDPCAGHLLQQWPGLPGKSPVLAAALA